MVLSPTALDLLNVIVEGEVTVHVLRLGVIARGASDRIADELLLGALVDLCGRGLIEWSVYSEYGRDSYLDTCERAPNSLIGDWVKCFGMHGPRGEIPEGPTISLKPTQIGIGAANEKVCGAYNQILQEWFEWPCGT